MIQKFDQFINESNGAQNPLSVHEKINEPFTLFIEKAQERLDNFTAHITYRLERMDGAISMIMKECDYAVVGEPIITVASDLEDIEVMINTNIPNNDEVWEADESPAQDLERDVNALLANFENVNNEIYYKPNEEGNCVIRLHTYILDSDVFGDYTDPLKELGLN